MPNGELPPSVPQADESILLRGPRESRPREGSVLNWLPLALVGLLAGLSAAWALGLFGS